MIYFRGEGATIHNGLNFYPHNEWAYSRGFILRCGPRQFRCRYSVKLKKWFIELKKET